jgi:hypothetical protein
LTKAIRLQVGARDKGGAEKPEPTPQLEFIGKLDDLSGLNASEFGEKL